MDQSPVRLACHRVWIALAQIANAVDLLHLVHRAGILSGLAVVKLYCAYILVAAMHRFYFLLSAQLLGHTRSCNAQHQQNNKDSDDQTDQHKPLFA